MGRVVVVVGGVESVGRAMERALGSHVHLTTIFLARAGGFRLAPYPDASVQMIESAADRAPVLSDMLIIVLPYARPDSKVEETVKALEELGATVMRPTPNTDGWPSRPKQLDAQFNQQLQTQLTTAILDWHPWPVPTAGDPAETGIDQARVSFAETLEIGSSATIETELDAAFWYGVLNALHELCILERRGEAHNKRALLRTLLNRYVGMPKDTYKVADTGLYVTFGNPPREYHVRERVHLKEGKPAETESVYWVTIGDEPASYRYLVVRIGRHA